MEPEVDVDRAQVARENEGDPTLLEQQDVEILVGAPGESASVKRGSNAVADNGERASRLEPRRGLKRESTQSHPDLQEEVEKTPLTVPVVCGSAPIQGGSSSSADVPVVCSAGCWNPTFQFWFSWIAVLQ